VIEQEERKKKGCRRRATVRLFLFFLFVFFEIGSGANRLGPPERGGGHRVRVLDDKRQSFAQANSMRDIGKRLLQSIGMSEPDDVSIRSAIEANDRFIAELEAIHKQAQAQLEHA
jgi:hypothetical protein